ncbi:MAG TPA: glycosyl transferase family 90 [Niabella sp.]|nr:glycosyl transferase family 90 [Niabella sp.]
MRIKKTFKPVYYFNAYSNHTRLLLGGRKNINAVLKDISQFDIEYLKDRVNYYNKLETITPIGDEAPAIETFKRLEKPDKFSTYHHDSLEYLIYYKPELRLNYVFGDITYVPDSPSIIKSRPVKANENSVVLKLDRTRHYRFVEDEIPFENKKNILISRGAVEQPHRAAFYKMYFEHPLCDLGHVCPRGGYDEWVKPYMSISEQLQYKFVLSLEGFDVATNLKWVMSSSSIAIMPRAKYETWFMEGRLIPDQHYICIKDDYSDLEEKLDYYINHPQEAMEIIKNANEYVRQFQNAKQERIINLLVLDKYFYYTGQTSNWILR